MGLGEFVVGGGWLVWGRPAGKLLDLGLENSTQSTNRPFRCISTSISHDLDSGALPTRAHIC